MIKIDLSTEFFTWFEREYSGDGLVEGGQRYNHLQEAFEAGVKVALEARCPCPDTVLMKKILCAFIDHGGIPDWVYKLVEEVEK
ncbi:MAG TPA: hypothetical protein VIM16_10000 [Mucilaginibacter sp.]|jgi:hypothetical protein